MDQQTWAESKSLLTSSRLLSVMLLCFVVGYGLSVYGPALGRGFHSLLLQGYTQKYMVASGTGIERHHYFIATTNTVALTEFTSKYANKISVQPSQFSSVFDAKIDTEQRHQIVRELRKLNGVSAVINIPLMCH